MHRYFDTSIDQLIDMCCCLLLFVVASLLYDVVGKHDLTAEFIISALFVSNFIGIVFARTLHYQFYCWYFHMLPYLLWGTVGGIFNGWMWNIVKVGILCSVEVAFNVFPATSWSSLMLQVYRQILQIYSYLL